MKLMATSRLRRCICSSLRHTGGIRCTRTVCRFVGLVKRARQRGSGSWLRPHCDPVLSHCSRVRVGAFDLINDLPPSPLDHRYILVVVCCLSKWVELIPLYTKESLEVAKALYQCIVARFVKPCWFRADAGKEFEG